MWSNQSIVWLNGSVNDPTITSIKREIQTSETTLLSDDFDDGSGWTTELLDMEQPWWYYPDQLWHIEDGVGIGNSKAWWYGKNDTGTYDTPEQPNAGVLKSPEINIGEGTTLSFWTMWDTEWGPDWDHKLVVVYYEGQKDIIGMVVDPPPEWEWNPPTEEDIASLIDSFKFTLQNYYGPLGYNVGDPNGLFQVAFIDKLVWEQVEFDLGAYAGKTATIGFLFNTGDEYGNDFQGWYIDDVEVVGAGTAGVFINVTNQMFNITIELVEGLNTIKLGADNGYLQNETSVNVTLDTISPVIDFIDKTEYTNQTVYNITWFVQDSNLDKAELYLNNELIQKKTSSGSYYTKRALNESTNTLKLIAVDLAGNTNSTQMNITLDTTPPTIEVMSVVYPTGVVSARPGDEAVIRVNATDTGVGIDVVYLIPPGGGGPEGNETEEPMPMLESEEFYKLMWDIEDATHFAPMEIPTDVAILTGNYTFNITAYDRAGNSVTTSVNVSITQTLSAFNLKFMPGWNLISLPLIPDNGNVSVMFGNVSEIESIWSYDANTSSWSVYSPGPAPDNLTDVETGKGYWVLTNSSAFQTITIPDAPLPPVAVPVKVNYTGVYLQPGQVPPSYDVYPGWNLIGFHSEVNMSVSEYLSGLTYPERIWTSVIGYDNYVDFKNNKVADGVFDRLQPSDYMKLGNGYWLYVKQAGEITP